MNRGEWLTCTEPVPLLEQFFGTTRFSKPRRGATGCDPGTITLRRVMIALARIVVREMNLLPLTIRRRVKEAIVVAERMCDEEDVSELVKATIQRHSDQMLREGYAPYDFSLTLMSYDGHVMLQDTESFLSVTSMYRVPHCHAIRDILHDPFVFTRKADWITPDIRQMAEAAHREPLSNQTLDPVRLQVLSDALEEAGCTDDRLINHLRGYDVCGWCLMGGHGGGQACGGLMYNGRHGYVHCESAHFRGCHAVERCRTSPTP